MIRITALLLLLILPTLAQDTPETAFNPPFYAFQNGIRFDTDEGVRLVRELGYQGVGSINPQSLAAFKAACDREGLKVFSIYAGGRVNGDGFDYDSNVSEAIALLEGSDTLVELNVQRGNDPNDEQAVAFVQEIAAQARESGLRVVLYPHAGFHIERLDHAVRIARATGMDNVGVTFNLCHFLKVQPDDDLAAALAQAAPLLWSASVCGADADGTEWTTLIQPLDQGTFDQSALLRQLRGIGFDGPVGLQCFNIRIDPRANLERSILAWRKHLGESLPENPEP